jgi:hypothetical protein
MGQTNGVAEPASLSLVRVDSLYYTGRLNKRWCSYLLAEEAERLVLLRANGSPLWSSKGHYWMPDGAALEIYPRGEWFNIHHIFDGSGALAEYYINIALPPTLQGNLLTYVDLDLDLGLNLDYSYTIHDEDEFLSHCDLWRYPPEVCDRARSTLDELLEKVARRDPLFSEWERYWPQVPSHLVTGTSAGVVPPQHERDPAQAWGNAT